MDTVRAILAADPVWGAYALADLQAAYAPFCQWSVAEEEGEAGLVLLFSGITPPILVTAGAPGAVAQALAQAQLPDIVDLSIREEHAPVVHLWYDNRSAPKAMERMVLRADQPNPDHEGGETVRRAECSCRRLGMADAARIRALYANSGPFTPDAFDPHQLPGGVFWGIETGAGDLAAVGGTHVVDWSARVAAIGNMYTHPAHRGRGYAGVVLTAIVAELRAGGVQTIVLNVDQRNASARRLYEQHGFVIHCPFIEGVAIRKAGR